MAGRRVQVHAERVALVHLEQPVDRIDGAGRGIGERRFYVFGHADPAAHALQKMLKFAAFDERHDRLAALAGAQEDELDDFITHV